MTARAKVDGVERVWDATAQVWRDERDWPECVKRWRSLPRADGSLAVWRERAAGCPTTQLALDCLEWLATAQPSAKAEVVYQEPSIVRPYATPARPSAEPAAVCGGAEVVEAHQEWRRYADSDRTEDIGAMGRAQERMLDALMSTTLRTESAVRADERERLIAFVARNIGSGSGLVADLRAMEDSDE